MTYSNIRLVKLPQKVAWAYRALQSEVRELHRLLRVLWVFLVGRVFGHIGSLDRTFGSRHLCDYRRAGHAHQRLAPSGIDIRGRRVVHRHSAISVLLAQEQHAEVGLAQACCIFKDVEPVPVAESQ